MLSEQHIRHIDNEFVSALFFKEWNKLVRYAKIQLSRYGPSTLDAEGRAEEIVQELFCTVCDKTDDLKAMNHPEGWLYNALYFKVKEILREDRRWTQGLLLLPCEEEEVPFQGTDELADLISTEDYRLLRQIYLEGYTYKELCAELGVSKSALGMRINRIKKEFRKKYEKYFS